jgi:uncharacterized protein YndB with AHSA1/START domain
LQEINEKRPASILTKGKIMEQTTEKKDLSLHQATPITSSPFVEVTKTFSANIEEVWEAWSNPELIMKWWGPMNFSCPSASVDFRIDGKYHFAMKDPKGNVLWSTGLYKEILPYELIVCTDQFADELGNPISPRQAGMLDWEEENICVFSVKFEKISQDQTKLLLVHEGIPASLHDDCVSGWSSSLDKMKAVVEKH